jgi:hypothetical protein
MFQPRRCNKYDVRGGVCIGLGDTTIRQQSSHEGCICHAIQGFAENIAQLINVAAARGAAINAFRVGFVSDMAER